MQHDIKFTIVFALVYRLYWTGLILKGGMEYADKKLYVANTLQNIKKRVPTLQEDFDWKYIIVWNLSL